MRRSFYLIAIAFIVAFIFLTPIEAGSQYVCGDANADSTAANWDSSTDISDAVWIINFVFIGGNNPCDTSGDGIPDC